MVMSFSLSVRLSAEARGRGTAATTALRPRCERAATEWPPLEVSQMFPLRKKQPPSVKFMFAGGELARGAQKRGTLLCLMLR